MQNRFHTEIRNTIATSFKPGRQLEILHRQLRDSEQEVEFFQNNLLLEKKQVEAKNMDTLLRMIQEIRKRKVTLQQNLRDFLTGIKYTKRAESNVQKSSQNERLIFMMTLLTGISIGVLFTSLFYKKNIITMQETLQIKGQVINVVEGELAKD